jgi:myo-inositol-1(or 4)-monophosphatase
MDIQPYYDFLVETAYRAGRITLGYYQTGLRPDYKPDDTPVTAADRAAEQFIRGEIEKRYPAHAILGEEFGVSQKSADIRLSATQSAFDFRWIIDPIDGTKSFLRGVPLYGVLLGLEIEGVVRAGAAYFPALDEMLCAADGLGCWWNGRRAHVSDVASLRHAYICYTNFRNMEKFGHGSAFNLLNEHAYALRGWSDAYGYLAVATGRAEMMLDPVMHIWDCGPFPPIFREAGGYFGNWQGNAGHDHGEALACNAALLPEVLALIRDADKVGEQK